MDIKITCPLGSRCEEIRDNQLHRCAWYINVRGKHPQSDETIDKWGCAIGWLPIMQIESTQFIRSNQQAIESLRNHVVVGQKELNAIFAAAAKVRQLRNDS